MTLHRARDSVGLDIFDIGAFMDKTRSPEGEGFKLKLHETDPKAPLSPIYLNLRTPDNPKPGPLTPEVVMEIGQNLYDLSVKAALSYDHIASVPRAGDPLVDAFAKIHSKRREYELSVIRLGKEESPERRQVTKIIAGGWNPDETVLVVDDLITRADSKLEAIKTLERAGLFVKDVLVFVDREQGGKEELRKAGYRLYSVFPFSALLKLYLEKGKISPDLHKEIKEYLA